MGKKMGKKIETIIYVPGRAVPMARPRVTKNGTYTPRKCREYKAYIQGVARGVYGAKEPITNPVSVKISIIYSVPKSWKKAYRGGGLAGRYSPCRAARPRQPVQAATDALIGIVYKDDSQIVDAKISKRYGNDDYIVITILKHPEVIRP